LKLAVGVWFAVTAALIALELSLGTSSPPRPLLGSVPWLMLLAGLVLLWTVTRLPVFGAVPVGLTLAMVALEAPLPYLGRFWLLVAGIAFPFCAGLAAVLTRRFLR
jgi:hypothetical protein